MAVAAAAGTGAGKRRRVKKSKRRTTAADANDSSSSSSSDSETEYVVPGVKPVDRRAAAELDVASSSSSSSSESSEESQEETVAAREPEKRHRKRTRKSKQDPDVAAPITPSVAVVARGPSIPTLSAQDLQAIKALGTPADDKRINETTSASLLYAQQYHCLRSAWKFNKARQEHLIRHMTSKPGESGGSEEAGTESTEKEGEEDAEDSTSTLPSGWPDEWNRCVALYLVTVQGAAKERLLQRLRQSAQQAVPAEKVTSVSEKADEQRPPPTDDQVKGVSFGDMAMSADQNEVDGEGHSAVSADQRARLLFERERARSLLTTMNESFY